MNKAITFMLGVAFGGSAGAGIAYLVTRDKFAKQLEKECEGIRSYYISTINTLETEIAELKAGVDTEAKEAIEKAEEVLENEEPEDDRETEYKRAVKRQSYSEISEEKKPKKPKKSPNRPYCITPEQYQVETQYGKVTLDYWNGNGVFTNIESDEEPEAGIWVDIQNNLARVGDYEDDTLFVRNELTQTDYEIYFHEEEWGGLEE